MILNTTTGGFIDWLKEKDEPLCINTKALSIVYKTRKPFARIIKDQHDFLIRKVCTVKRDLYKFEQDYIDQLNKNT